MQLTIVHAKGPLCPGACRFSKRDCAKARAHGHARIVLHHHIHGRPPLQSPRGFWQAAQLVLGGHNSKGTDPSSSDTKIQRFCEDFTEVTLSNGANKLVHHVEATRSRKTSSLVCWLQLLNSNNSRRSHTCSCREGPFCLPFPSSPLNPAFTFILPSVVGWEPGGWGALPTANSVLSSLSRSSRGILAPDRNHTSHRRFTE